MDDMKFVLSACALVFVLACGVSVLISYFLIKARVAKNEEVFMRKIRELTDGIDSLKNDMAENAAGIDALDKKCETLRGEYEKTAVHYAEQTEELRSEIESVKTENKKSDMKFADINDRLNIVDSTVKNIERMKNFEINGAASPYFFDEYEERESAADAIKEKIESLARKAAILGGKFNADALAGTAFGIINALKKHFDKE